MADANSWALLVGSITGLTSLAGVAWTAWNSRKQSADQMFAKYFGEQGSRLIGLEDKCAAYEKEIRDLNVEVAQLRGAEIVKNDHIMRLEKKIASTQAKLSRMSRLTSPDIQAAFAAMDSEPEDDNE